MERDAGTLTGSMRALLAVACFVVVVAGMKAASNIVVPFLLSLFIAIICAPGLFWLQQKGLPKMLALTAVVLMAVGAMILVGLLLGVSIAQFTDSLPEYQTRLKQQSDNLIRWVEARGVDVPEDALAQYFNLGVGMRMAGAILSGLSGMLANAFLILLAVVFILMEAANLPDKIRSALPQAEKSLAGFREFVEGVNRYLVIKTAISAATGVCAMVLCGVMRVEFAVLWGMLAFLLNFVPNIGSVIAAVPPVLLALIDKGLGTAGAVTTGYIAINVVFGSILEPRIMGGQLGISTMVVFFSLIFWGWVLGPIGMVLTVPLTMVVKIAMETNDDTRWLAVLLGAGEPPRKQTATPAQDAGNRTETSI